jgi:hypothetical protein
MLACYGTLRERNNKELPIHRLASFQQIDLVNHNRLDLLLDEGRVKTNSSKFPGPQNYKR